MWLFFNLVYYILPLRRLYGYSIPKTMQNLSTLFCLFALIFFVLFIIGFFNPRKALFWSKKPATKGRSARVNGIAMAVFFVACGLLAPPSTEGRVVKEEKAARPSETAASPSATAAAPDYKFEIAHTERGGGDIRVDVVMPDLYPREALIEKARQLKAEYSYNGKLTCFFYYKKYGRKTLPVAGAGYRPDCSNCGYKDKDGNPIDFPFYHLQKARADSLRVLAFDSAGFTTEAHYFTWGSTSIMQIMSSKKADALLVFVGTDGHFAMPLIKKTVRGEDRFYDPDEMTSYYVVNRNEGFVDCYSSEGMHLQNVLED